MIQHPMHPQALRGATGNVGESRRNLQTTAKRLSPDAQIAPLAEQHELEETIALCAGGLPASGRVQARVTTHDCSARPGTATLVPAPE
jgi:hypothetical protein